jgi:guanine nucleotide-binding protein G(I)/G(S)/G(T) subunit beta-1
MSSLNKPIRVEFQTTTNHMSTEQISTLKKDGEELLNKIKKTKETNNDGDLKKSTVKDASISLSQKHSLIGHMGKVWTVSWSADNRRFISSGQDGKLIVWNALTSYKIHAIPLKTLWVMCCGFSPNGSLCASGGLDNLCSIFNCKPQETMNSEPVMELNAHTGYISSCKFIGDKQVLTSSGDQTCILWDVEKGNPLTHFKGEHTADVMCLAVSPDGSCFVSGGVDCVAKVWDIRSGKASHTFRGHTKDINGLDFMGNGLSVVSGSEDGTCKLFDLRSSQELMSYTRDKNEPCSSVSFSKSGRFTFAGYSDNVVCVWDTLKGKKMTELKGHNGKVSHVAVSPDGSCVLTASWDKTIKVWA